MFTVAIVGRPNVGKSTLFNRIAKQKLAITDNTPGVTRDRIFCEAEWLTKKFKIIDTGGLTNEKNAFQKSVEEQINFAIAEADVILFLCSYQDGINANDIYAAKLLKKVKGKMVLLAINKTENSQPHLLDFSKYYALGFGKPLPISSEHGIGIGDLLDKLVTLGLQHKTQQDPIKYAATFSIIGKPNVGKSSLLNQLLGHQRVLVSEIAGTTRDAIDAVFRYHNEYYKVIDTAGIRRKGKIDSKIEKYSLARTELAISRSEFIILMIDGSQPITEQDEVIGGLAFASNLPTIIAINKWDLVQKDTNTMNKFTQVINSRFQYLSWAPIIYLSAKENSRINTLFETIKMIQKQINLKVSTSLLNDVITQAQTQNQPPIFNGDRLRITYTTQAQGQIPTFVLFCNDPKYLHFSYARYLEKKVREAFGFKNTPITLYFKSKNARNRNLDGSVKFKQEGYNDDITES
ncbi:ribosome biogenesis GTPase Der [[Mycoplasma] testudinis]|uniref:ribosome biogenesis GTPase Der n=1 Tax=[Mycoplasma] testudinis TaxID=33924 RepID=UPI000487DB84|nr:ribosome biogenesis GTPase Der [[Mycoplasma] testudinis]